MNMKNNGNFTQWYNNQLTSIIFFFREKLRSTPDGKETPEDLTSETFIAVYKAIEKDNIPKNRWNYVIKDIREKKWYDFYRKFSRGEKKYRSSWALPPKENGEQRTIEDIVSVEDETLRRQKEDRRFSFYNNQGEQKFLDLEPKIWQMRKVLTSKHRPLQDVMLIARARLCDDLIKKMRGRFSFIADRFQNWQSIVFGYSPLSGLGSASENFINKWSGYHHLLSSKVAKPLRVDDPVGLCALEVLLFSPFPWRGWYFLSMRKKVRDYPLLARDQGGNFISIRKKTIKRPRLHFFRDYMTLNKGLNVRDFKKFIQTEACGEYPDLSMSREWVINRYDIGSLGKGILKKQKSGRSGRPGLKKEIENYNAIIKEILNTL